MLSIHDVQRPFLRHFRSRRMAQLIQLIPMTAETKVLDIGGNPGIWELAPIRPRLTFLNIWPTAPFPLKAGDTYVHGDARKLQFKNHSFDVAYSNSVIEHLGTWENQSLMAAEIRRVASRYYVQTPNRGFFVEPHLMGVGIHWLPRPWQRRLIRRGTVWGWLTKPTRQKVDDFLAEVRLLSRTEMAALFPDGRLLVERAAGLPKSFVCVR